MPRNKDASASTASSLQHLLSPEAPADTMTRELVFDSPGLIVAIDTFLTAEECSALISAAAALGLQSARPDDLRPKKGEAFINRETLVIVDDPLAAILWLRLLPHLPPLNGREPVGLNGDSDGAAAQFKFYQYRKGHRFGAHVDTSHRGAQPGDETEFTLLEYLNSAGEALAGEPASGDAGGGGDGPAAHTPPRMHTLHARFAASHSTQPAHTAVLRDLASLASGGRGTGPAPVLGLTTCSG